MGFINFCRTWILRLVRFSGLFSDTSVSLTQSQTLLDSAKGGLQGLQHPEQRHSDIFAMQQVKR